MEREADAPVRARSTPRAVVAYLKAARTLAGRANDSRQLWIRQLGILMRSDDPTAPDRAAHADVDLLVTTIRRRAETARASRAAMRAGARWPFGGAGSPARAG